MTNDVVFKSYMEDDDALVIDIYVNDNFLGYIELDVSAGWVFHTDGTDGFWSQRVVYTIADKMRELNTKLFGEDPEAPKAEEVKPAIRHLDLND